MPKSSTHRRRIVDAITMAVVSGLSLLLLIYVGYGEAQRTYEQFHLEKLVAQNKVVQSAIEGFLRRGLPLDQYVGFGTRAARILASDETIAMMAVFDDAGKQVFTNGDVEIGLLPAKGAEPVATASEAEVRRTAAYIQVVVPLDNRYERVGSLAITMPRAVVTERVWDSFRPLVIPALFLSYLFAAFVSLASPWLARQRAPWLQIVYGLVFVGVSLVVVGTLVSLYSEGAQAKTKALADSLGQRLTQIVRFQLDIDQIAGLDQAFVDYRRLNPDISAAALTVDGQVMIHTDPLMIGEPWVSQSDAYEYVVDITPPGSPQQIKTAVDLPAAIVYWRIARSVKNFAALFIASAFLASVFLQLAGSMQARGPNKRVSRDESALNLVKPVFYVAMGVEHLTYSFLPQFTYDAVAAAGLPSGFASAVFMIYYLCFALALVPAGHYAQRAGQRPLMTCGLALVAVGLIALMLPLGVAGITMGRAFAGIGQGMLFIGVQSYILNVASPGRKTQGAAIIVFGFQGGMISGMAIGSLLVGYIGAQGVFTLGAVVAAAMAAYAAILVPETKRTDAARGDFSHELRRLTQDLKETLCSRDLLATIGLIGIPAKAVLTGVIVFALPLLMAGRNYAQEDIGQVVMIYAAGVVLASGWASRLVDRSGRSAGVLFLGAVVSGLGLILMALIVWPAIVAAPYAGTLETVILVAGVATVGLAHGLINAPIVTHVAELDVARRIGTSSTTAAYRFMERVGHVAGPIVVGQLFLLGGQDPVILAWIGGAVALFGLVFLALQRRARGAAALLPVTRLEIDQLRDVVGLYMDAQDLALVLGAGSGAAGAPSAAAGSGGALRHSPAGSGLDRFLTTVAARAPAGLQLHAVVASRDQSLIKVAGQPRYRVHRLSNAAEWRVQMKLCLRRVVTARTGPDARGAHLLAAAIGTHVEAYGGIADSFVWIAPNATRAARAAPPSNATPDTPVAPAAAVGS